MSGFEAIHLQPDTISSTELRSTSVAFARSPGDNLTTIAFSSPRNVTLSLLPLRLHATVIPPDGVAPIIPLGISAIKDDSFKWRKKSTVALI